MSCHSGKARNAAIGNVALFNSSHNAQIGKGGSPRAVNATPILGTLLAEWLLGAIGLQGFTSFSAGLNTRSMSSYASCQRLRRATKNLAVAVIPFQSACKPVGRL